MSVRDRSGQWVTPRAADFRFSLNEVGCDTAQCTILDPTWIDLASDREAVISDPCGRVLWTGNAANPGGVRSSGALLVAAVTFSGNAADLSRRTGLSPYYATYAAGQPAVTLQDRSGATVASNPSTVRADQVVEDVLYKRAATLADRYLADITASTAALSPVAYESAVTARQVLDDMLQWDDYLFRWGLRDVVSGLAVPTFGPWPESPRYLIRSTSGVRVEQSGSDSDLRNRVIVTWSDKTGKRFSSNYDASTYDPTGVKWPDAYDLSGVYAADPVDLGDALGSQANADIVGPAVLAQVATLPDAMSVQVSPDVPVVDLESGAVISPDRMTTSEVVHVQDAGRMARLTGVDVDNGAVRLTLGRQRLSTTQILARLLRKVS